MIGKTMVRGVLAVALVASVSFANAATYTYTMVDYPAYETDQITGDTDTISGTIITNSNNGTLSTADLVGGTIYLTNPDYGTFALPVLGNTSISGITATPEQLILLAPNIGHENDLTVDTIIPTGPYANYEPQISYRELFVADPFITSFDGELDDPNEAPLFQYYSGWGTIEGTNWVIATAQSTPEPSTLTLLCSALLGLGVVYLRRRKAKP
ncbi:MAG: PEP-CTERM sorting domain-containing protein [Thermoguttaceae bacterium]|jgi:hypothetical protein